ncbi:MAG TPA: phosphoserine phosphatase SerB [Casimicrobiaceae bacterium]|nr:phosphoserine phosphatase SerB [Casimicrobiaceae bacterium]
MAAVGDPARADLVVQGEDIDTPALKALARLAGARDIVALTRAATQAFRLSGSERRDAVAGFCLEAGFDFAFVPRDRRLERVRLVAFDMDSTLITIECIDEIADMQGIKAAVAEVTASAMRGEIDFRQSLQRRVALLAGLPIGALQRVYDERLALSPGAERMVAGFRQAGARTLLVSGGFSFFTERLKSRLGIDYALAGALETADGRLTGRVSGEIVDGAAKAAAFAPLREELRGGDGLALAIGDGANDLPMLRLADVSVAYHAKPVVRAEATHAIDHSGLDAILNLFA